MPEKISCKFRGARLIPAPVQCEVGTRAAAMARYILFTFQKGGVGKSKLARSTAVALSLWGRKVLFADFDSEQRTCLRWQAQRKARRLEPMIDVAKFSKESRLNGASQKFDDVVMDTRGRHDYFGLALC